MKNMTDQERKCLTCQKELKGRSDKKFCNEYCRNVFNNNQNLRKNRKILEGFLRNKHFMARAPQYRLFSQGFRFQFFTHTYTNRQGRQYFFCYEYGYMLLDKERVLIVKRKPLADQPVR
jgi:predicted nucleic acid-binding Zn ribbon protein